MHTRPAIIKCILPITCRLNTWFMASDSRKSFMNGALKCSLFNHINLLLGRNCFWQRNYRLERNGGGQMVQHIAYAMTDTIRAWQFGRNLYWNAWCTMTSDASFVSIINYFIHSDWMIYFVPMNNDLALEIRDLRWGRWIFNS